MNLIVLATIKDTTRQNESTVAGFATSGLILRGIFDTLLRRAKFISFDILYFDILCLYVPIAA